ncbi:E3 ubiquitin-protein ligase PUB23-like isoform X1 [Vicia villosa]|uniref:E3 ubiquitin-protein ligase PUB23-like isoform X1 n=1 Tax=Vicia villosa TaxID=3911 RepID=UPI00273C0A6A|nr:E3 ubiquitin-protein ligase PUB23-like isoform X1 [Vicia villosa]
MGEIEIPQFFICPISLQIMKEPVTTLTGITYNRESIEHWLLTSKNCTCPITKQPLPRSSEFLTPNHTLQRLIQSWHSTNSPSSRISIEKSKLEKLVKNLDHEAIQKLHTLALEDEGTKTCLVEAGVAKAIIQKVIIKSFFKQGKTIYLEQALRILRLLWPLAITNDKNMNCYKVDHNFDLVNSLTLTLQLHNHKKNFKVINEAMLVLKHVLEVKSSNSLLNLNVEFFREIVKVLRIRNKELSKQAIKSALHVLLQTCPLGRNRMKIVEAKAVTELIDLALEKQEKNQTELIFTLLADLCSCADGREQFVRHAAGIAVVSKRTLRVSATTDDRALQIFCLISKYCGTHEFVQEMLRVGAVSKLCMVMQADCASYLKEKARGVLRLHSNVWNDSPCIQVYLFTRHQR